MLPALFFLKIDSMKNVYVLTILLLGLLAAEVRAGNPDRQGEAGAYELLMNPWARSAGLHTMTTSMISGVEAMRLNVAGIGQINKLQVYASHALYLQGTDISMSAGGASFRLGKNGALALTLMSLDFGDIPVTTTALPEGTGSTFSPNFLNIGIGYAHTFAEKISVGFLVRAVSESLADLNSFGIALDAGVQYRTGNFKFGVSLRNIGTRMKFSGEALGEQTSIQGNDGPTQLTFDRRNAGFDLPSTLNIGMSYDFLLGERNRITVLGNFTANSFSRDQIGGGIEYAFDRYVELRAGYKVDMGSGEEFEAPIYTGLALGASLGIPLSKRNRDSRLSIDYAYRTTRVWDGTHNFGLRFDL